jgi:tripartite-type tricarboxylate transporter receptor subunit TctC
VLSDRDIARRVTELAIAPIIETPAELTSRIAQEQHKWKRVIERMTN